MDHVPLVTMEMEVCVLVSKVMQNSNWSLTKIWLSLSKTLTNAVQIVQHASRFAQIPLEAIFVVVKLAIPWHRMECVPVSMQY